MNNRAALSASRPITVSVVVPCRNERRHIDAFIDSVLSQKLEGAELHVIIADGMSDDGTRETLESRTRADRRLVLVDNPGRIVSTGLNLAVQASSSDYIVRMDVHTTYAEDYVAECLRVLRETGATCVGGPWVAKGDGLMQRAIAQAFQSRFGSGGAASRNTAYSGPADTVYLGAWRRADLLAFGGFDESLVRNQDDELNLRILRGGGRVWQSCTIRSEYRPRASLAALFRQFRQYGYWKVPVIRKHRLPASPRHLAPFGFVAWLAVLVLATPFSSIAAALLLGSLLVYASVALVSAVGVSGEARSVPGFAVTAMAFACMHVGYGLGFGRALWDFGVLRRSAAATMTRLTR